MRSAWVSLLFSIALLDDISYKWESCLSQSIISFLSASDYHRVLSFTARSTNQHGSISDRWYKRDLRERVTRRVEESFR